VVARDAASGRVRWVYSTAGIDLTDPVVAAGAVYAGSDDHKLYALDAATGKAR
jgi:outer membrane protein assembly factor BamB